MAEADRGQPPTKRQRVSQACNACRRKKSRCNGRRPKCSSCSDLGIACEYLNDVHGTGVAGGSGSQPGQVDVLVQRMADLERRLARSETRQRHDQSALHANTLAARSLATPNYSGVVGDSPAVEATPQSTSTDGMAHFVHAGAADPGYFGPSSNIALMRDISEAGVRILEPLWRRSSVPWGNLPISSSRSPVQHHSTSVLRNSHVGKAFTISKPGSPRPNSVAEAGLLSNVDPYALPDQRRALELLNQYFAQTGLLFPYLSQKDFVTTYNAWSQHRRTVHPAWVALLNIVFALAVHATWSAEAQDLSGWQARHEESALYYARARQLCPLESLEHTTIEAVQCLVLMAQYLQGTPSSITTWTVHGLAVKAAMQLGLHSPVANEGLPASECEQRKRTWYGCVIVDRTLSMTFGRPSSIAQEYIKLPQPEDMPSPQDGSLHESSTSVGLDFFGATIKLYQITASVLTRLFDNNIGVGSADHKNPDITEISCRILMLEEDLRIWSHKLSGNLRLIERGEDLRNLDDDSGKREAKFRAVLTLRYHNLNILLHRPMLTEALMAVVSAQLIDQMPTSPASKAVFLSSLQSALDSAAFIIDFVHSMMIGSIDRRSLLGAWWFVLYYTFNAALVVFASALLTFQSNRWLQESLTSSSRTLLDKKELICRAAEALEELYNSNGRGDKCAWCLRQLEVLIGHMVTAADTSSNVATELPSGSEQEHFSMSQVDSAFPAQRSVSRQPSISLGNSLDPPMPTLDGWDPFDLDFLLGYDPVFEASPMQGHLRKY